MSDRAQSIFERIMSKVESCPDTGCELWTGATSGNGRGGGYPRMSLNGQTVAVHRVVATHHYGYIPSKMQVDHVCKTRLCLKKEHLEIVTNLQNQRRK